MKLNDDQIKVLKEKNFAFLGTIRKDGRPQVSPVWIDFDGSHIIVNSEEKRAKVRNIKRDPRVSVSVANAENPYQYFEFRGKVTDITKDGASDHIDQMAKKYLGQDNYPFNRPGDVRVIIKIDPQEVAGM